VESYVRMRGMSGIVRNGERKFFEMDGLYADSTFFKIFSFPLLEGDARTALVRPYSVVLTETAAKKYFDHEDPVGKLLDVEGKSYTVTGLAADVPENSHFTFGLLMSFSTIISESPDMNKNEWWYWNGYHTYFLLKEGNNQIGNLRGKMRGYIDKYIEAKQSKDNTMHYVDLPLQALPEIYLAPPRSWENGPRGSKSNVYILSIIAIFILITASFNYINLATARASRRLKEVGLRKVLGAQRRALIQQFLGESLIVCFVATLVGVGLAAALLPLFNTMLGTSLNLELVPVLYWSVGLPALAVALGCLSGAYPALMISGFHPLQLFRSAPRSLYSHNGLRRLLVAGQFVISITLIAGTLLVFDQLSLLRNRDLGFDKDLMLQVKYNGNDAVRNHLASIKEEILRIPGVKSVAASAGVPGESTNNLYSTLENGEGKLTNTNINTVSFDPDFIPTFGIRLLAGRNFSKDLPADDSISYILNAAAVKQMGFKTPEDAIGKEVRQQYHGKVIGVVEDFHYKSLHHRVEPLLIHSNHWWYGKLSLKLQSADVPAVVNAIEKRWGQLVPDVPFLFSFVDQDYDRLYKSEMQLGKVVTVFSVLAILVSSLGLFGLTTFAVERRFKEIGIRKALGASVSQVMMLISTEFFRIIVVAFVLSVPLTWYMISLWLENFTDHISIGVARFVMAGASVLIVAWLSVSLLSLKAARHSPADSLRSE
jgi:putative ABC transport system permease protein